MKNIAVIPNMEKDPSLTATKRIAEQIISRGGTAFVPREAGGDIDGAVRVSEGELFGLAELAVVLGGDGTVLNVASDAAENDVPLLGINFGNLGFLSRAERGDTSVFDKVFAGEYTLKKHMMLKVSVKKRGEVIRCRTALNDVVIERADCSRMINLEVAVNNSVAYNYSADGVIVSSATGSTAYSLSAGGAIMHPSVEAIMITPICPHTLKARCMVMPSDGVVSINVKPPYRARAVVSADGRDGYPLSPDEHVEVVGSDKKLTLLNLDDMNFFDLLKTKLEDR